MTKKNIDRPMTMRPRIAILDANTLSAIGLKQILQNIMPIMDVHTFNSFEELQATSPEEYVHYFVSMYITLEHRAFFLEHVRKTIVLTTSQDPNAQLNSFNCVCINVKEEELVRSLLQLEQHAHAKGKNLPKMPDILQRKILSDREIEVLALIVQGLINKEIADRLNISMTTVITHRKNIMDKLGMRSVSALTIYAVMNGYVDINAI